MVKENSIIQKFYDRLESINCKGHIVSAKHIKEIFQEIQKHKKQKLFDSDFYEDYKNFFEAQSDIDFPQIKSVFIIAFPHPATRVKFHWHNEEISLLIPPTYLQGREIIDQLKELLVQILSPEGYKVIYARIPAKTLAVHSGLAEYGKNNITYVQGMGSFYRLSVFYSDFPLKQDKWHELHIMELCKNCSACVRNCPTGAIPTDRFLLHAERCLTYHNEHPPEMPFPDWINPEWHNCLVGCLYCQTICPANKNVINWIEKGPEFSQLETQMILEGKTIDQLPEISAEKLKEKELVEYLELFPRNLNVFLKNN